MIVKKFFFVIARVWSIFVYAHSGMLILTNKRKEMIITVSHFANANQRKDCTMK